MERTGRVSAIGRLDRAIAFRPWRPTPDVFVRIPDALTFFDPDALLPGATRCYCPDSGGRILRRDDIGCGREARRRRALRRGQAQRYSSDR